jgi:hypothetical protein
MWAEVQFNVLIAFELLNPIDNRSRVWPSGLFYGIQDMLAITLEQKHVLCFRQKAGVNRLGASSGSHDVNRVGSPEMQTPIKPIPMSIQTLGAKVQLVQDEHCRLVAQSASPCESRQILGHTFIERMNTTCIVVSFLAVHHRLKCGPSRDFRSEQANSSRMPGC